MPARKTSRSARPTRAQTTTTRTTTPSEEISYETKLIIVILLLLFVYPIGVIFMWLWMREWPAWLKVIISLPIILGILAIIFGLFFGALLLRNVVTNRDFRNQMMWNYQYQRPYMHMYRLPATPSATVAPTDTPAEQTQSY